MSQLLVKKALQLFQNDLQEERDLKEKKKKKKKSAGETVSVNTNKKGVLKQKRSSIHSKQNKLSLQAKRFKPFQGMKKDAEVKDHTQDNLDYLQQLAAVSTADEHLVHKISSHSSKKILKKQDPHDEKAKQPKSVFSDRDFDKFEEEYDFWS